MKVAQIARILEATDISAPSSNGGPDISSAFAADLMSDVLTLAKPGSLLLTGLTTPQVVRTSELAGVAAIVLVRGKRASAEMKELADEAHIPILESRLTLFEACGRLHAAGIRGCDADSN